MLNLPDLVIARISGKRDLRRRLGDETVDLVIAEEAALPAHASRIIRWMRALTDQPDVIVVTAEDHAPHHAELLSAGCTAVLHAGLSDDAMARSLGAVVARLRLERGDRILHTAPSSEPSLEDFVSSSQAMQALVATAWRVAESDTSLLILGETGVGKERLARAIHGAGARRNGAFVAVNCGAIPEALLESELFGHEKGAFTGAVRAHRGYFELAHHGTFFLDEVGDLPQHLQVKLLRVLQDHKLQPVGGERSIDVDVRVIAATSQDLEHAAERKQFRQDLYYRLSVVTLTLPPLREREHDILVLADTYRAHFAARLGRPVTSISRDALRILASHDWPGNVRELANVMERAVLLCAGEIIEASDLAELARHIRGQRNNTAELEELLSPSWADMPWRQARQEALAVFERFYLARVLQACQGRVGEAARRAGLNPRSLYEKMQRHHLRRDMFRNRPDDSGPTGP